MDSSRENSQTLVQTTMSHPLRMQIQGFVELSGAMGKPDIISALPKLIFSFQSMPPSQKKNSASTTYPLMCSYGHDPQSEINIPKDEAIKQWTFSENIAEVSAAASLFKENAKNNSQYSYFLGFAYLLGRGVECHIDLAFKWLKQSSINNEHALKTIDDLNELIQFSKDRCQRTNFLKLIINRASQLKQ